MQNQRIWIWPNFVTTLSDKTLSNKIFRHLQKTLSLLPDKVLLDKVQSVLFYSILFCINCLISCFLPISPCNMGMSFNWRITCFEQAIQFPPSLFFANISWHPKTAGSPFFKKTWQWLWGYFCWSCGKFQCVQSGYHIPASQKWLPLSPAKHLLPLHWKWLYLDICV